MNDFALKKSLPLTWAGPAERPAIQSESAPVVEDSLRGLGGGDSRAIFAALEHWTEAVINPELPTGERSQHRSSRDNDPSLLNRPMQMIGDLGRGVRQEGFRALIDPLGAIDRQDAQRDLASRFDIVDADDERPRLSNELTQKEFEQLAYDYSDIRMGRSHLRIDGRGSGDPAQYKADAMQDIGDIMQTGSGRALVRELAHPVSGAPTTLVPSATGDALERGRREPGTGTPDLDGTPGKGSEAVIQINPQRDVLVGNSRHRSDVALYHEMVHALFDVRGMTDMSFVDENDAVAYDVSRKDPLPRAEHQAVGIGRYETGPFSENLYRRERRALALSGEGRAGDLMQRPRESYRGGSTYASLFGL